MSNKPIGQIIGDLTAILYLKDVITLEEFIKIIGEDNYKKLVEEVKNNG
jgi:hypothetical protein